MAELNLDDLKIEHQRPADRGGRPIVLAVVFLIGLGCGAAVVYFWTLPRGSGDPSNPDKALAKEPSLGRAAALEFAAPTRPPESFTEGGWIEVPSYHPVRVSALVPGRIETLEVLEGSPVKKGDLIARLYDRDFRDEATSAQAELSLAEAELARLEAGFRPQEREQARAEREAAAADLALKERIFERTRELLSSGAVSAEDLDRDQAYLEQARAALRMMEQELLLKEEGYRREEIEAARAEAARRKAMLDLALNRLAYTEIRSPIDGVVLERFVTPGSFITASDPVVVSLYDPNDLQVRVDVRQENIGAVFLGQPAEVFTDAEPERAYAGEVIRIEPLADFKKNTIQVKIKLYETSDRLHPEMVARILFKDHEDV